MNNEESWITWLTYSKEVLLLLLLLLLLLFIIIIIEFYFISLFSWIPNKFVYKSIFISKILSIIYKKQQISSKQKDCTHIIISTGHVPWSSAKVIWYDADAGLDKRTKKQQQQQQQQQNSIEQESSGKTVGIGREDSNLAAIFWVMFWLWWKKIFVKSFCFAKSFA